MSGIRLRVRGWLQRLLRARARDLSSEELAQPAIVVAPHFDDEVLGCGGTMLRKLAAGAHIRVVFMTDGGKSHRHLMPPTRLSAIRAAEALAAAGVLGIDPADVVQFGFEEGRLPAHASEASARLDGLLRERPVTQVFCPYRYDDNPDHEATNAIVRRALLSNGRRCVLFEYPVWAWHIWPWCPAVVPGRRYLPQIVWSTLRAQGALLRCMTVASNVGEFLRRKELALQEYRSQTSRLIDDPRWLTLQDVGSGDFVRMLLTDREFFCRSTFNPSAR